MKRTDASFAVALMLLGSFVGVEAFRSQPSAERTPISTTSFGSSEARTDHKSRRGLPAIILAPRADSAATRSIDAAAEVRRRLQLFSPGTYIGEVLTAHDSSVARWPERRGVPLHVWIQESPSLPNWNPDNAALVREAFIEWTDGGVPLDFTFVLDSATADVHVTWVDRFSEQISGKTLWTHDDRWWILGADILIALHHRGGEPLDGAAIRAISLHEVGHLIGLDHTSDSTSIMTPRVRTSDLAPVDRATVQLVYSLPPGSIREQPSLPAKR